MVLGQDPYKNEVYYTANYENMQHRYQLTSHMIVFASESMCMRDVATSMRSANDCDPCSIPVRSFDSA